MAATDAGAERDVTARVVVAALASLGLIQVEDLPETFTASTLVGSEYMVLIAVSLVLAAALVNRRAAARLWLRVALVSGSATVSLRPRPRVRRASRSTHLATAGQPRRVLDRQTPTSLLECTGLTDANKARSES